MLTKSQKQAYANAIKAQNTLVLTTQGKGAQTPKNLVLVNQKKKKNRKSNNFSILSRPNSARIRNTDPLRCYAAAQLDPFCDDAMGCRVPDVFPYPTATYHSEGTIIIKSDTNGMASVLLLPHPFVSTIDMSTTSVLSTGQTQ